MHHISSKEVDEILAKSPAPRVTREMIEARISDVQYNVVGGKLTICQITLDNKFVVSGECACADVKNFSKLVGEKVSYDKAISKMWELMGFLLAERLMLRENMMNAMETA
jgi:hypothetical protein